MEKKRKEYCLGSVRTSRGWDDHSQPWQSLYTYALFIDRLVEVKALHLLEPYTQSADLHAQPRLLFNGTLSQNDEDDL